MHCTTLSAAAMTSAKARVERAALAKTSKRYVELTPRGGPRVAALAHREGGGGSIRRIKSGEF